MYIGTLIADLKNISGNDGKVHDVGYKDFKSGRLSTSNRAYVVPNYKTQGNSNQKLLKKIENGLKLKYPNLNISTSENLIKVDNLSVFVKPYSVFDPNRVEKLQVKKLLQILFDLANEKGNPFYVKIGNKEYKIDIDRYGNDIIQSIGTKGDKADIILKTSNFGDVFISLKGNETLQWAGVSDLLNQQEVEDFKDIMEQRSVQGKSVTGISRKIVDNKLIKKSLYGKDYESANTPFGVNNVNHIIKGEDITYSNGSIRTNKIIYNNGELPTGTDSPYIQSNSSSGRNDLGFNNVRVTIWPGSRGQNV
jgi:hypothetical protein